MGRVRTWKVLQWHDRPERTESYCVACPECGTDAFLEVGKVPALVIGAIGLGLIFDTPSYQPPSNFLPNMIRCRTCRMAFTTAAETTPGGQLAVEGAGAARGADTAAEVTADVR
jgi:hypothetical protein